jgi:hypothetical protein
MLDLARLDLLTLRDPIRRQALVARFLTLRRTLRDMGFQPELLDAALVGPKQTPATMLEKLLAMALVYCGFNYEQAVGALVEANTLDLDGTLKLASSLRRAVTRNPQHPVMLLVRLLLDTNEGPIDLAPELTLRQLYNLAMGDLTDVMSWDADGRPSMIPSDTLPRTKRGIVTEITHTTSRDGTTSVKVKGVDKLKALELLAKHQGLLAEKLDVQVDVSIVDRLEQARSRAQAALIDLNPPDRPALTHQPDLPHPAHNPAHSHEHLHIEHTVIDLEDEQP